jgi:predicted dehydrogenase
MTPNHPGGTPPRLETAAYSVAVVGCGYWGVNYLRVLSELPDVASVTACDEDPTRLKAVGERFRDVALVSDFDEILASPEIEAVVICTPATAHYEVARRCLEAGKHLLIEKPITTRSAEALELLRLADERDLTLAVGHTFLYNPGIQKVKGYVTSGALGSIYYMYSRRTNLGPIRQDVNALWDLAPHDVSIFNYLLESPPAWVSAVGRTVLRETNEDFGFVSIGYESGVVAHIHVSWADPNKVREVVVVGSEQRIVFDDIKPAEPVRVYEKGVTPDQSDPSTYGEARFSIRDGDIISPKIEVSEPLKNQCRDFLECLASGRRPLSDAWAGLAVVEVMEAIDRSIDLSGAPVPVGTRTPTRSKAS